MIVPQFFRTKFTDDVGFSTGFTGAVGTPSRKRRCSEDFPPSETAQIVLNDIVWIRFGVGGHESVAIFSELVHATELQLSVNTPKPGMSVEKPLPPQSEGMTSSGVDKFGVGWGSRIQQ